MTFTEKTIYVRLSHANEVVKKETPLSKLNNLADLKYLVKLWLNLDKNFVLQRKSKRASTYVKLETLKDFKSLKRSLEVKDTLKLKVLDLPGDDVKPVEKKVKSQKSYVKVNSNNLDETTINKREDKVAPLRKELKSLNMKLDEIEKKLQQRKEMEQKAEEVRSGASIPTSTHFDDTITAKNTLDVNADVFIDIPISSMDYKETLVEILSKYNTASKLLKMDESVKYFEELLNYVHGDVNALFKIVKDSSKQQKNNVNDPEFPHIHVDLSIVESKLKFVLTNNDDFELPKNMKLVLQILDDNRDIIYTINLFLGDNTMKRRLQRTIYYNLDGIDKNKLLNEGFVKLMLIKDDGSLHRVGYGQSKGLCEVLMKDKSEITEEVTPVTSIPENSANDGQFKKLDPELTIADDLVNIFETSTEETPSDFNDDRASIEILEVTDNDSTHSSNFATPSNSTVLIDLSEATKSEKAPSSTPTPSPTPIAQTPAASTTPIARTPIVQTSFEELANSNATLTNTVLLNISDDVTTVYPIMEDGVTDFSEISETDDAFGDEYEILSADDFSSDHENEYGDC